MNKVFFDNCKFLIQYQNMFLAIKMMQSLDGIIARSIDDDLSWGSSEDKKLYKKFTIEFGTVIVGSTTFEQMPKIAFKNRLCIVLTRDKSKYLEYLKNPSFVFIAPNPNEVVQYLESQNIQKAVIIGGSKVNNLFLEANLVDEIFVTIAPRIFGNGVRIFGESNLDVRMELKSFEKISDNELLLNYKVI
jgi:dihydrofolate reductase